MGFREKIHEKKTYVVMAGLIIGALNILDYLPKELPLFGKEYTEWAYLGIIGLAAWTFYEFYWSAPPVPISFARSVPNRNLSSQSYQNDIQNQFGQYGAQGPQRSPAAPAPTGPGAGSRPSKDTFDKFKQD